MKYEKKTRENLYSIIYEMIPIMAIVLPIGICLGSMGVIYGNIILPNLWRNIIAVIGCICMIGSTFGSIVYRHTHGEVYSFKNASKSRVVGFIIFIILFSIFALYMILDNLTEIWLILVMMIWIYLGGYLCFKYIRVKKNEKDYDMALILIYLSFTFMLLFACIQVWFNLGGN